MKTPTLQRLALLGGFLFSVSSFAQYENTEYESTTIAKKSTATAAYTEGVRFAMVKPNLTSDNGDSLGDQLGVSLGYASLPVQQLGWTTNVVLIEIRDSESTVQLGRVDGNLAHAFNEFVNIKAGLNLSKYLTGGDNRLNPGLGLQASIGFQLSRGFGIDVGYSEMNQTSTRSGNLKESGPDLTLSGTF
jgi:hypothetical protein